MPDPDDGQRETVDGSWFIVGRRQEFEGEGRANLIRIIAVGAYYSIQLFEFHSLDAPRDDQIQVHQAATAIAAAWSLVSLGVLICMRRRRFPGFLKFATTGCDLIFLTSLALIGNQAGSPLLPAYFLILVMATLRFHLPLVWFATLGSLVGYVMLLGASDDTWFDEDHAVPLIEQGMMVLSLALCGVLCGQVVRRVRVMAREYADRVQASRPEEPRHEE